MMVITPIFIALLFIQHATACTEFIVEQEGTKTATVARTMEFAVNSPFGIISLPEGRKMKATISNNCPQSDAMTWENKHKTLYIMTDTDLISNSADLWFDGLNTAGLSIGALYLPDYAYYPSEVPSDKCRNAIAHTEMVNYVLTTFGTVAEVRKALEDDTFPIVWSHPLKVKFLVPGEEVDYIFPIHWSIVDKSGDSLVLEYTEKEGRRWFFNEVGAFTNSPTYDWHLTNLNSYVNIQRASQQPKTYTRNGKEFTVKPFGHGSGFLGLPGDFTPPSRFVRVASMVRYVGKAKDSVDAVRKCWHILNAVDAMNAVGATDDFTLWMVVKDLENGVMYYRGHDYLSIKKIDLNSTSAKKAQYMLLDGKFEDCVKDVTKKMSPAKKRNHQEL